MTRPLARLSEATADYLRSGEHDLLEHRLGGMAFEQLKLALDLLAEEGISSLDAWSHLHKEENVAGRALRTMLDMDDEETLSLFEAAYFNSCASALRGTSYPPTECGW